MAPQSLRQAQPQRPIALQALFLNASANRWTKFRDKIIYLYDAIPSAKAQQLVRSSCFTEDWSLEWRMRTKPVQMFRQVCVWGGGGGGS